MERRKSESGQVLVFLAISVFILIGFAASLSIDGGLIYSARRHAQNSSDAASLAGGSAAGMILDQVDYEDFKCNNSIVVSAESAASAAAVYRAGSNDFTITPTGANEPDENEVAVECKIFDNGSYVEKFLDVKTNISSEVTPAFLHIVYSGNVKNTVKSVVRVFPRIPLAYGKSIVSLSLNCSGNEGGVRFDGGGNSDIVVNGGGIFSNSCLKAHGSSLDICVAEENDGDDDCEGDGDISFVGTYEPTGNPSVEPTPDQVPIPLPYQQVTPPDCSSLPNRGDHQGAGTIQPGRYSRIRLNTGTLTMQPGLYCLSGNFTINGGSLYGEDITIYMQTGDFSTAGGATQQLSAPPPGCGTPGCPPAMPGMLIFMAESNQGVITLQGNTDSYFEGTIFAPKGTIDLGGGSSTLPTFNTQLIGWTVKVHGNVTIDINYDGAMNYHEPATLDLYR